MTVPSSCPLVGNSFIEGGRRYLRALHLRQKRSGENTKVYLMRNPKNEYDSNAIEVWFVPEVPLEGLIQKTAKQAKFSRMLGHLPKDVAAELAPLLDRGDKYQAEIYVKLDPEHPEHPGATIYLFKMVYI